MRMRWFFIGLLMLILAACKSSERGMEAIERPCRELVAIDTMMWRQPDSAFAMLLEFAASPEADSLNGFDGHYFQLLVSELLYKNDYEQTNRQELLKAVAYFDSVNDVFLNARSHYINGVGYYERDSVVEACIEYLKALEIMEESLDTNNEFIVLIYNHLTELFSDCYLHEQAIYFGKRSLDYYDRFNAEPWHLSWTLNEIGAQYNMMEQMDSAEYYYQRALLSLPDTNSLLYRDISTRMSYLSYYVNKDYKGILQRLHELLQQAECEREYLARCLIIGDVFYQERQFDSAWMYLNRVFDNTDNIGAKKQSAEWLVIICKSWERVADCLVYADYLVPFANQEENQSMIKSQLTNLYNTFTKKKLEQQQRHVIKKYEKIVVVIISCAIAIILFIYLFYKRTTVPVRNNSLEQFLEEPICHDIIMSVQGVNIKRLAIPKDYPNLILDEMQLQQLALAVNRCFVSFESDIARFGISPNSTLCSLCHLYLLGMDEKKSAILLNRDYSSIKRYEKKLKSAFGTQEDLVAYLRRLAIGD